MQCRQSLRWKMDRIFRGKGYGAKGECYGEVVFNTSITGYQEIFTDPSYAGQIVVLTNPEIGNYGTNSDDNEATRPYIEGLIVREFSRVSSNWRSQEVAEEYLERYKIPVLAEIDTRALVRHLRDHGVMRGVISTLETDTDKLIAKARSIPKMDGTDLAKEVTTRSVYQWDEGVRSHEPTEVVGVKDAPPKHHVVAYDYGIKHNILRRLVGECCDVTVVPATTTAEDVLALKPDGVFLSNGPGDPEPVTYAQESIRQMMGTRAHLRHLPRTSADRPRAGRQDLQAEVRASRRQSSGEAAGNGQGRDHRAQSQLRRRSRFAEAERSGADAHRPERQHAGGPAAPLAAAVQRAVPPRGLARPARLALPVQGLCEDDGGVEGK